jgi:2-polyprenyl-3-methyl-5-hydroxy-6-metoxy-1,4-benzoquinol methylase
MTSANYDIRLLDEDSQGSLASARIFLAYLFKYWAPKSVIDFGCGLGTWLHACRELGTERLVGLDGDWVTEDRLIDRAIEFRPTNFQQGIVSTETFDLAISLEVVEHLPPDAADRFIQSLKKSAGGRGLQCGISGSTWRRSRKHEASQLLGTQIHFQRLSVIRSFST